MTIVKRRVLCCGLMRSGSTWQFNVVREYIARATGETVYAAWTDDYSADTPALWHVVKSHRHDTVLEPGPDTIVSSVRDVRAVVGSLKRMGWLPADEGAVIALAKAYVAQSEAVGEVSHYVMRYEDMMKRPTDAVLAMGSVLGLPTSVEFASAVVRHVEALEAPSSTGNGYDRATLLHPGHIGARHNNVTISELSPSTVARIEDVCAQWLMRNGYN
ncbi:hypothetical protein [Sphingomonas montanisoli]|uniref:Sulfotransferase domain-containing protein n=1 Tax=Sphingomonas montanisoli TaxID=2606412 RepID=A0A5D9C7U7_9SPHN|nr:hypothetical protein [Sphingomonas montanisoli]TZG27948.1 hypothetical protein FYJ91_10430 [Sphingomonas montanisoli]